MPKQIINEFVTEENKMEHFREVLLWLTFDFFKLGAPKKHFFHNRNSITVAFNSCNAMVALASDEEFSYKKEVVGYMIWSRYDGGAEIDIIEVEENYRRQGIAAKMLKDFCDRHTDVSVLTTKALPQAENFFDHEHWRNYDIKKYTRKGPFEIMKHTGRKFKCVQPVLQSIDTLPNGHVIAVCSEHFYRVKNNVDQYQPFMKYFPIDIDQNGKLQLPIVTDCHEDGYMGVFLNKELIVEGKAKHLFKNSCIHTGLFLMCRLDPCKPELFHQSEFFSKNKPAKNESEGSCTTEASRKVISSMKNNPTLFKPERLLNDSERLKSGRKLTTLNAIEPSKGDVTKSDTLVERSKTKKRKQADYSYASSGTDEKESHERSIPAPKRIKKTDTLKTTVNFVEKTDSDMGYDRVTLGN